MLLLACEQPPQVHSMGGHTMGTGWSVQFAGTPVDGSVADMREAVESALERVNAQMSTYREDSHISRFNTAPAGEAVTLPDEFRTVLRGALDVAELTGGALDPTVGPLVNLWGFGPDGSVTRAPDEQAIREAAARVGWRQLRYDDESGTLVQPGGVYLDLSAVAKGYAVDLIGGVLDAHGIEAWLVDIGGDMRARGRKPDGSRWRVAIERPVVGSREIHTVIEPGDMAVATSGNYRNFFRYQGREYSHIIDPRSGYPVSAELPSVTVVDTTAKRADALATALSVLGPEEAYRFALEHDLAVLLLVRENGEVVERATAAFERYRP